MITMEDFFREGDSPEALGEDVLADMGPDIVSVVDEDGKEHVFEELDRVELPGGTYVALAPLVGEEEDAEAEEADELILLRVDDEEGETYLSIIEDETEFNEVGKVISDRLGIPFDVV